MNDEDWLTRVFGLLLAGYVALLTWTGKRQINRIDGVEDALKRLDADIRDRSDKQRDRDEVLAASLRSEIGALRDKVESNHTELMTYMLNKGGPP